MFKGHSDYTHYPAKIIAMQDRIKKVVPRGQNARISSTSYQRGDSCSTSSFPSNGHATEDVSGTICVNMTKKLTEVLDHPQHVQDTLRETIAKEATGARGRAGNLELRTHTER